MLYRLPGPSGSAASGATLHRLVEPGPRVGVWWGVTAAMLRRRSSRIDWEGLVGRSDSREIDRAEYASSAGIGDVG